MHRGYLHSYVLADLCRNFLVESNDRSYLRVVVYVLCDEWSLESLIVSEKMLLTGLAGLSRNFLFYCVTIAQLN